MTTPKSANYGTAKKRFFALYAISILLVLVLFASFTQGVKVDGNKTAVPASSAMRIAIDDVLHQRLEKLESVRAQYAGKDTSAAATDAVEMEKASFFGVVDSIRKASSLASPAEKQQIDALLTTFSRSAESGVLVLKSNVAATQDSGKGRPTKEEMDELKEILAQKEQRIVDLEKASQGAGGGQALLQEKDKTIASLQSKVSSLETQLSQKPNAVRTAPAGDATAAEWQTKYNKMKEQNDQLRSTNQKFESQANALKTSYKEVIDDNKRLASQVQALKAGKN